MSLPEFKLDMSKIGDNDTIIPDFGIIDYTISSIVDKIKHIDTLDEEEIKKIIIQQHDTILNYNLFLQNSETRKQAQDLFTSKKFLSIFIKVINILNLSTHEITCINKLTYDYYVFPDKDNEIFDLLMQISNIVNYKLVIRLSAYLGMNGARILAMIRNSSFKLEKVVHRVNTFLVRCNIDLNIEAVIGIFCILFDHFTYPFIYTMLYEVPKNITEEELNRYNIVSAAMICMLDSMTTEAMKQVLSSYAYTIKLCNIKNVRFGLKNITTNKPRIINTIRNIELESSGDLIIP